ncbi:MAG: transcriptional regulator [Betaproteobacteria bacterium]|nr:transcriptional regulator [Betaproteobacteria bacterium]
MKGEGKIILAEMPKVCAMVENIVGCKWSLQVLHLARGGVCRPGAMQRSVAGLTPKVLNERLRKLVRYGILERIQYPEVPPCVEYRLTNFGRRFARILDDIDALQRTVEVKADANQMAEL